MGINKWVLSLFTLSFLSFCLLYIYYKVGSNAKSIKILKGLPQSYNIFMVETNSESDYLTLKQLCCIESNALHNPNAKLNIKSMRAKINQTILFEKYPQIEWSLMNIEEIFEETPLKDWWIQGKLTNKDKYFRFSHLSDALRLALVYKYGGFYSDLDHIALKNFEPLTKFSAFINGPMNVIDVESSFFHLKQHHSFFKLAMKDYALNYDGDQWAVNGPKLLSRCIKSYCNTTQLLDILIGDQPTDFNATDYKCDLNILPDFIGYPIRWEEIGKAFEKNSMINISRFIRSYTIHLNSYLTSGNLGDENSIVQYLMSINCPTIYEISQKDKRKPLKIS